MRQNIPFGYASAALLALSAIAGPASAASLNESIENALNFYQDGKKGSVKFDLNYRYENVNQDKGPGNPKTANANTVRLRLGLLSPVFHGLQGYVEYEGNYVLQSDYNNGLGNKPGFSTVADPDENELNQLWISYAGIPDTLIKGGRQRIKLDDDRFIGNVGWRQLETTFDSVLITYNSSLLSGLTVNAGYIGNVNTFLGTTENINAPILNINYKVGDYGNLIGYGYWLDYTERENYAKSNQTYGLRFNGKTAINDKLSALYTAEWSFQKDYQHSPTDYEAHRFNLMGGLSAFNMITVQGAMEQMNGLGANKRFLTPLGTNHAFQGWADQFLVTPNDGIRDVFGTLSASLDNGSLTLSGVFHDFSDDTGRIHYGKEWDFLALKKFGKHYALLAKYAYYDADQFSTDTQKIWLQGNISF
ncbi:alginate export family protein [Methylobacter sp. BBA5.1]|uniref:alginate export family protein n=1 Tax=Methylobacter sp. BBA5.1 TaxID=1495064 RepID=UPI00056C9B64|nr:alginate export family protein [Methylobacter sp. BBA5.1]